MVAIAFTAQEAGNNCCYFSFVHNTHLQKPDSITLSRRAPKCECVSRRFFWWGSWEPLETQLPLTRRLSRTLTTMSDPRLSVYAGQCPSAPSDANDFVDGRAFLWGPHEAHANTSGSAVFSCAHLCMWWHKGLRRGALLNIITLSLTHLLSLLEFYRVFMPFGDIYLVTVPCLLSSNILKIFFFFCINGCHEADKRDGVSNFLIACFVGLRQSQT